MTDKVVPHHDEEQTREHVAHDVDEVSIGNQLAELL